MFQPRKASARSRRATRTWTRCTRVSWLLRTCAPSLQSRKMWRSLVPIGSLALGQRAHPVAQSQQRFHVRACALAQCSSATMVSAWMRRRQAQRKVPSANSSTRCLRLCAKCARRCRSRCSRSATMLFQLRKTLSSSLCAQCVERQHVEFLVQLALQEEIGIGLAARAQLMHAPVERRKARITRRRRRFAGRARLTRPATWSRAGRAVTAAGPSGAPRPHATHRCSDWRRSARGQIFHAPAGRGEPAPPVAVSVP